MAIMTVILFLGLLLVTDGVALEREQRSNFGHKSCPFEWSAFGFKCFKYFKSHFTWTDAELQCLKYGGNLASVHSYQENIFLQNLIKQATGYFARTWLGSHDSVKEGTWLWSDGSKHSFQDWGHTQPSNYLGMEHCLEINYGGDHKWNDDQCHFKKPFICAMK